MTPLLGWARWLRQAFRGNPRRPAAFFRPQVIALEDRRLLASLTAAITPVSPNPTSASVAAMTIAFSAPVTGFDLGDLRLKGPGNTSLLTASQTLTTTDNQTWTLGNLAGLTDPTHRVAGFTLALAAAGSGITGPGGATLTGDASTSFTVLDQALTLSGTALTMPASAGSFTFSAGSTEQATDNGVTYTIDPAVVSTVQFNGNGSNLAVLTAGGTRNSASLGFGAGTLQGTGYTVSVSAVKTLYVAGGTSDSATFADASGQNTFIGTSAYSYLSNGTQLTEAAGFGSVTAASTAPASDTAQFSDTSGSNTFVGTPTYSYMNFAGGASVKVISFRSVVANAGVSSNDKAYLYDTGGSNLFLATPTYGYQVSSNFNEAVGFKAVVANAAAGASDHAYYYDNAGQNSFTATPGYSALSSGGIFNEAIGYTISVAIASLGSKDTATLSGSTGSDSFIGTPTYSYFVTGPVINYAVGFISVEAVESGGTDSATLYDAAGANSLFGTPTYVSLSGTGYAYQVLGFTGGVTVQGTVGDTDNATLYGSPAGSDRFVGTPTASTFSGTGFTIEMMNFGSISVYSQGPQDLAYLYDDASGATFTGRGSSAALDGPSYSISLDGFATVIAVGSTGTNTLALEAVNYLFSDSGTWS